MAEYISITPQIVAENSSAVWQTTAVKGGCNIQHRDGTSYITVKGSGCCCNPARYKVFVHIVITAAAAELTQMALAVDGIVLPETTISMIPAAVGDILSGSTGTVVLADCGCDKISLVALTEDVPLTSALITVERIN